MGARSGEPGPWASALGGGREPGRQLPPALAFVPLTFPEAFIPTFLEGLSLAQI